MIDTNSALFWVIPDEVNCIQFLAWRLRYGAIVTVMASEPAYVAHKSSGSHAPNDAPVVTSPSYNSPLWKAIQCHTWWVWAFSKVTSPLCPIVGHNGEELGSYHVPYAMIVTSLIFSTPCFPNFHAKALVFDSFI